MMIFLTTVMLVLTSQPLASDALQCSFDQVCVGVEPCIKSQIKLPIKIEEGSQGPVDVLDIRGMQWTVDRSDDIFGTRVWVNRIWELPDLQQQTQSHHLIVNRNNLATYMLVAPETPVSVDYFGMCERRTD